ncbi:hypothetical protein AM228_16430 [Planktothricoides sp. SR001]|uniref:thermonuclease family protein n=1 Tax=Planktothricoides sp. SR001 TaxID=1705388 RepID=UPI0006C69BAB|nr:hypothetical protein [Planktothricoides sp. SR001]KOR35789.1 hypothetical protein AM228_16430 [Planktothricoides sp. SR001]
MKTKTSLFGLITGIILAVFPQTVNANHLTATVEKITDGDTVVLNQGGRSITTQLACIDSPDWVNGLGAGFKLGLLKKPGCFKKPGFCA